MSVEEDQYGIQSNEIDPLGSGARIDADYQKRLEQIAKMTSYDYWNYLYRAWGTLALRVGIAFASARNAKLDITKNLRAQKGK